VHGCLSLVDGGVGVDSVDVQLIGVMLTCHRPAVIIDAVRVTTACSLDRELFVRHLHNAHAQLFTMLTSPPPQLHLHGIVTLSLGIHAVYVLHLLRY